MAVVPMKRLELFALRRDRKAILELLQRRGVVEVESTQASGEVFRQADTSQAQQEQETHAQQKAHSRRDESPLSHVSGLLQGRNQKTPHGSRHHHPGSKSQKAFLDQGL